MEPLSPESWATIKAIGSWSLPEIRTQVRAMSISCLAQGFELQEGFELWQEDATIADALDDVLARIRQCNAFEEFAAWKMEGERPMFLEIAPAALKGLPGKRPYRETRP
jgi:hypothetical protein